MTTLIKDEYELARVRTKIRSVNVEKLFDETFVQGKVESMSAERCAEKKYESFNLKFDD